MKFKVLKAFFLGLMLSASGATSAGLIIDNGKYTTFTDLNIDIYDVYEFVGLTHQEVIDRVNSLGNGWRFASTNDVWPLYELLSEEKYINQVKDLLGYYSFSPIGTELYYTGGRVIDMYPDSNYPDFNYLWGLGNGIYNVPSDGSRLGSYVWSSFGIGQDMADSRFTDMGAWVVRDAGEVPEPSTLAFFALGLMGLASRRFKE